MELTRKGWDRRAHSKGAIFFFFFSFDLQHKDGLEAAGRSFLASRNGFLLPAVNGRTMAFPA